MKRSHDTLCELAYKSFLGGFILTCNGFFFHISSFFLLNFHVLLLLLALLHIVFIINAFVVFSHLKKMMIHCFNTMFVFFPGKKPRYHDPIISSHRCDISAADLLCKSKAIELGDCLLTVLS